MTKQTLEGKVFLSDNQVKKTSIISLEAFVLHLFAWFFFYLSVTLSFICFFILGVIWKCEQVFLAINPTSLMGWLGSLRFSDIFVDCLITIGHLFSPLWYMGCEVTVSAVLNNLGVIVGRTRACCDHWVQYSSTDSDSTDRENCILLLHKPM